MSIKRTNSRSYIQNKYNRAFLQQTSDRYILKDIKPTPTTLSNTEIRRGDGVLLKTSQNLIESSKQNRPIAPDKLKRMRHVFSSLSHSQSMSIERLSDALFSLGYDPRKDLSYQDFVNEHELNETSSSLLNFEEFVLLVIQYEEKLRIEDEALRQLDLKIAFEYFDMNKDGMIDINELSFVMNILNYPITDREAKEMIEFGDRDKDGLLSFDEFLLVLTQISAMNIL